MSRNSITTRAAVAPRVSKTDSRSSWCVNSGCPSKSFLVFTTCVNYDSRLPPLGLITPSPAATAQTLLCHLSPGLRPNPIGPKQEQRLPPYLLPPGSNLEKKKKTPSLVLSLPPSDPPQLIMQTQFVRQKSPSKLRCGV